MRKSGKKNGAGWVHIGAGWRLNLFSRPLPPLALGLPTRCGSQGRVWGWLSGRAATGQREAALGLVALALLVGPGLVGLLATPITETAGAVAGVGLGCGPAR